MIRRPVTLLVLLTGLNLLNYLDRFVVSAVLESIKGELNLGYLGAGAIATVFLLGYFVTSPIFGSLGDRGSRKVLIAIGVLIWSAATIASGLSKTGWQLIAARAVVGVGEASYATIAPTIIDDVAPPEKRGRWLGYFYLAIPAGSALGYLVGGTVERHAGWREAFFVAGGPGILLALLCLLIAEPKRTVASERPSIAKSFKTLVKIPAYRQGVLGYAAFTWALGAFAHWGPLYLQESYSLPKGSAAIQFGGVLVVAGAIGSLLGGWLGDRRVKKAGGEKDDAIAVKVNMSMCALSSGIAAPAAALCVLAPSSLVFFSMALVCLVFVFASNAPINVITLRSVPVTMRASAMALSIFSIHLLGDLWSPTFVGGLGEVVPMKWAMMALPLAFAVSAAVWSRSLRSAEGGRGPEGDNGSGG
jgi:MFS family permease